MFLDTPPGDSYHVDMDGARRPAGPGGPREDGMTQEETPTCDRCQEPIDAEAASMGWPIAVDKNRTEIEYICPECYGPEAFCREGHVLPADVDSDECGECGDGPGGPGRMG